MVQYYLKCILHGHFTFELLHLSKVLFITIFGIYDLIMFYVLIRIVLPSCL